MKPHSRKVKAHLASGQRHRDKRRDKRKAYRPRTTGKLKQRKPKVLRGPLGILGWRAANVGARPERQRQKVVNE